MTDADREMLIDVWWTLMIIRCLVAFYVGYLIAGWVKKFMDGE